MLITNARVAILGLLLTLTLAPIADAQFVRVGPFGRVRVSAPGVGVRVGPVGGVRVNTPGVSVNVPAYGPRPFVPAPAVVVPGRVTYGYRHPVPAGVVTGSYQVTTPGYSASGRVVTGGQVVSQGAVVASGGTVVETGGSVVTAARVTTSFATEAELAAMSDADLLIATQGACDALHTRLGSFTNGASWKSYFAVDAAAIGQHSIAEQTLGRFDTIARDGSFSVIADLDEFSAARLALQVLVARGGVSVQVTPAASTSVVVGAATESIPVPASTPSGATGVGVSVSSGGGVDVGVSTGSVDVRVERSVLAQ